MTPWRLPLLAAPTPVSRDDAAAEAARELSRAKYHRDDPSLISQLADRVQRLLSRALNSAENATPGGLIGIVIIIAIVVGIVIVIRVKLGKLPLRDLLGDRRPSSARRTAQDYRDEAETLAAAGDHAEALRATTRALVRELEDRGVVEPRPGRTAAGIARRVAAAVPSAAADTAVVTTAFDEVWYGGRAATAELWQAARAAELRVRDSRLVLA